jgi:hypothetical protein
VINNTPYSRKKISTLLLLSATILMLLLAATSSLPPLSNPLLQPVQAQTAMNFRTPTPATGTASGPPDINATLTFDVHGTQLVNSEKVNTNGGYKITSNRDGKILDLGSIFQVEGCCLTIDSSTGKPIRLIDNPSGVNILISTSCSTSATNHIDVTEIVGEKDVGHFQGPVECSPQGGNTTTTTTTNDQQQSSSSSSAGTTTVTTTSQDRDRDGILDANDNCPNLPNTRCYKEGDTALVVHNSNR